MDIQRVAFIVGLAVGALMVVTVCIAHLRSAPFGIGGSLLTCGGVVLIGLSVFSSASISVNADGGFEARFESLKNEVGKVNANVKQVSDANQTVTEELTKVAKSQEVNRDQVTQLTSALVQKNVVTPEVATHLRTDLHSAPRPDFTKLDRVRQLKLRE